MPHFYRLMEKQHLEVKGKGRGLRCQKGLLLLALRGFKIPSQQRVGAEQAATEQWAQQGASGE